MFSIIRLLISGILFCVSRFLINKSKYKSSKKLHVFVFILSVLFYGVLSNIPIENTFLTFDSPKAAIAYYNPRNTNIELIVNGDGCDFVIIKGENITKIYSIIPKTSDGWKIGTGKDVKIVSQRFIEGFSIHVYQYKKSNNYFVTILNSAGGELTLNDTHNSEFKVTEQYNEQLGKSFFTYYTHVTDFDQGYYVEIEAEDGSVHRYDLS